MTRHILIITIVWMSIFHNFKALCQEEKSEYDTTYIQSFRDYLVLTLVSAYNSNTMSIADNNSNDITFSTNLPFYFGLAADYKWFSFEYTKNINTSLNDKMGRTYSKSLGLGITGRKYWFRSFWKEYEGYYMQNPEYDNPDFNGEVDPYPLRPDLHTSMYYANLNYGFNYRKFSNMASLWQLEKQKKSAGSFTVGLSLAYTESDADSTLVLSKWEPNFKEDALITNYHLTLIGINGGYLHTFSMFPKKRFFISLAFIPGISYQYGKAWLKGSTAPLNKSMMGSQTEARIVFGYIHNKWYASFSANFYAISNAFAQDNSIVQSYNFLRFVYGRKIKLRETKSTFLKRIGL